MNSRWSRLGLVLLTIVGCSQEKPAPPKGTPPPIGADPAAQGQQDAEFLGQDVFVVVDEVTSYESSHRGRLPRTLRQVGLDSLTPATIRRLTVNGTHAQIAVAYRRPEGRRVTSCRGTSEILEEALMNSGQFTVHCALATGVLQPFKVGRRSSPKAK